MWIEKLLGNFVVVKCLAWKSLSVWDGETMGCQITYLTGFSKEPMRIYPQLSGYLQTFYHSQEVIWETCLIGILDSQHPLFVCIVST